MAFAVEKYSEFVNHINSPSCFIDNKRRILCCNDIFTSLVGVENSLQDTSTSIEQYILFESPGNGTVFWSRLSSAQAPWTEENVILRTKVIDTINAYCTILVLKFAFFLCMSLVTTL